MRNAEHLLVAGPSGGGKTTHLREMHARHDGPSVFLTPDPDEHAAAHRPAWRTCRAGAQYPADIQRVRRWAREHERDVQVIVDEVQGAPSFVDGDGPVKRGLHRDRKAGVKWVIATQNPMDLRTDKNGYGPVQQADKWVFVGPARTWHTGFFRANDMADLLPHLPTENYEYVVIRPLASLSGEDMIVYRGTTDPTYG